MTSTSSKVVVGGPGDGGPQRKSEILPNLQIPSSINPNGGSIGEFAAKVRPIVILDGRFQMLTKIR